MNIKHGEEARKLDKKKELAQLLYIENGKTQQEIADFLGCSQPVVGKWASRGRWRELREGLSVSASKNNIARLQQQIAAITERIVEEGRLATEEEARTLKALSRAVATLEGLTGKGSLSSIVDAGEKFLAFLISAKPEKAMEVFALWDAFILNELHQKH